MRHAHGPKRLVGAVVSAVLAGSVMVITGIGPAHAGSGSSSTLCTGFVGCLAAGRSDAGYAAVHRLSFWTMVAGHNCTNYAAYRLTHGRTVARPPGTAGAATWGGAARLAGVPVDDRPAVGAIAWWGANARTAGAGGHVAYVEEVRADGSILLSEDSLGGYFKWRHLTRASASWPSGFIHYPESDGSPAGTFLSATSPEAGRLDFWGTSGDPNVLRGDLGYLVTLGGPRGAEGVETFSFATPYFRFHRIKTVATRGPTTMYLYALNALGTAGSDTLLGVREVTVRRASSMRAAMVDRTIRTTTRPKVTVSLTPTTVGGTVDVRRGSTRLATATVTAGRARVITLPRLKRGWHTLSVRYRGSSLYAGATRSVTVRVR